MTVNLSGTITDVDTSLALEGVAVSVVLPDDDTAPPIATTLTDSDGLYSVDLEPASVKVWASFAGYDGAYYGGATEFAAATVVELVDVPVVADMTLTAVPPAPPPPPSGFSLGTVVLWTDGWSGFAYPTFVQVVPIISDGSSVMNSVIQSGSQPRRTASISLPAVSDADLATLIGYHQTAAPTAMITPLDSFNVIVTELQSSWITWDAWSVTLALVESA